MALLLLVSLLGACATNNQNGDAGTDDAGFEDPFEISDPLEPVNRVIFDVNFFIDRIAIKPVAKLYRDTLPPGLRDAIQSFLRNISTPVILANDLLQGEFERAWVTTARFIINSTVGAAGLYDAAAFEGYEYHDEDFGQTLASYGVSEGFYLVLPIFGPSTLRDAGGMIVDHYISPLTYVGEEYDVSLQLLAIPVTEGIDSRSRVIEDLDRLQEDSLDFYAAVRSLYWQRRLSDIENGRGTELPTPGLSNAEPQPDYQLSKIK